MALNVPPVPIGEDPNSFAWQQWYLSLDKLLGGTGTIAWGLVDKSGSSLADLASRDHSSLQNMQGGTTGERYHLTQAQALAVSTLPTLAEGTYTPTVTAVTNVDAVTASLSNYIRVGDTVHVSGTVSVDPTAAGLAEFGVSLPVASNFANTYDLAGVASLLDESARITADTTNNRAHVSWTAAATTNRTMTFTFTYQVI